MMTLELPTETRWPGSLQRVVMPSRPKALDLFCGADLHCVSRGSMTSFGMPSIRNCRHCQTQFGVITRGDANRQYCSRKCARKAIEKSTLGFHQRNPSSMVKYNQNRKAKNPGVWTEQHRQGRLKIIAALGGKCVVCGIGNVNWLEVDFCPTTRGKPFRHPRHPGFVLKHLRDFRLLCANHHRELTLTGKIEEAPSLNEKTAGIGFIFRRRRRCYGYSPCRV